MRKSLLFILLSLLLLLGLDFRGKIIEKNKLKMETGDDSGVDGLGHSGIEPGGAGVGDTSLNGGNDSENHSQGQGENSICRDYMRNVCTRGKKCKYAHPESKGDTGGAAAALLQVCNINVLPKKTLNKLSN